LRYMRDPLPVRLGGLAATLGRISSNARQAESPVEVAALLDEAKHYIEWTAAEAEVEVAADLVDMQRLITYWQKVWKTGSGSHDLRILLSIQAKTWSEKTLEFSGLL
jgi:hypothetical protein